MTQQQLAQIVSCSPLMIVMWKKTECESTASAIVKLSDTLGCTTDYLLGKSDI